MSLFEAYDPTPATRPAPFAGLIRPARAGDPNDLAGLSVQDADAVAILTAQRDGTPLERALEKRSEELVDPGYGTRSILFVAEEAGAIRGFGRARLVGEMEDVTPALRPPPGWYLMGVIVDQAHRRRGIGRALTQARLDWLRERTDEAFYFARRTNQTSIALHEDLGFHEHMAEFEYPRTGLRPGDGMLYRVTF